MSDPLTLNVHFPGVGDLLIACAWVLGFILVQLIASLALPAKMQDGALLANGTRIRYRLNGLPIYVGVFLCTAAAALPGYTPVAIVPRFFPLFIGANLFAFTFTFALYVKGRRAGVATREGPLGLIQDLFYGVELNPRFLGIDLKMFSYRPSLIGLSLVNVSFAFFQFHKYGYVTGRMWLFQGFYFFYLASYFQYEHGMLFTWDIIAEKFGWMLVWGDYVFVPFFYSLPGWFLVDDLAPLPASEAAALALLFFVGFGLFRGANEQKNRYKTDPTAPIWGKPPETVGGKLLVSGLWGIGRKLNYTGELFMYYAWTLPCGFSSPLPYLVPLWLTVFFPHRAFRDEQRCKEKYGPLWDEYCKRARFRMIPFIY